jgi:glc operon protein GlcG
MRDVIIFGFLMLTILCPGIQGQQQASAPTATAPANPPQPIPLYGDPISLERAQKVMAAAEAEARRLKVSPALAILDSSGHLVMFEKLDNSDYGNGEIAVVLARSAVEFRRPTKEFADAVTRNPAEAFLPGVVPFQGGWPILVDGRLVGALGVVGARGGMPENGKAPGILIEEAGVNAGK